MSDAAFCATPGNWKQLKRHEYSADMGDMTEAEFAMLVHDMEEGGFNGRAILLIGNKTLEVLDGWHQLRAAALTNSTPTFEKYTGKDAFAEVWRRHGPRKHWNESQRAMIGAKVSNRTRGNLANSANLPNSPTREHVAETLNVSPRSVTDAAKVLEEGTPKLQRAVMNGEVKVSDAVKIVDEPASVQNAAVATVKKGGASTVAKAVASESIGLHLDGSGADTVPCPTCRGTGHISKAKAGRLKFVPPTVEEVAAYFQEQKIANVTAEYFVEFYASKGWMVGKNKMTDWKAAARRARTWTKGFSGGKNGKSSGDKYTYDPVRDG